MKGMLRPGDLARALFLPFVRVIGGSALLLAALYLLIGVDPTMPVGNFVLDSVTMSLPWVERLFAIWLLYTLAYLLLGACRQDLWVISLALGRLPKASRRPEFSILLSNAPDWLKQSHPLKSLESPPRHRFNPSGRLHPGWVRGLSPQLE